MSEINLRPWQAEAKRKCIDWYLSQSENKHFLINAAPGAGKTICASVIANDLINRQLIDRVIIIAPRAEVVRQWSKEYEFITGRHVSKVTGADEDLDSYDVDLCATWSAIQNLTKEMKNVCNSKSTLVICDEHHHAAVSAAWGKGADSAFSNSKYSLILTGTPIRSDGNETVWLAFDSKGKIDHPDDGTYTLSYGKSVDLGYCRPVTFHRHEGNFEVSLGDGSIAKVSGAKTPKISTNLKKRIRGIQAALDFYKLACTPQFLDDGVSINTESYQGSMIKWGVNKLNETRKTVPNAGGLIIAPNIAVAEYMCSLIEEIEGEKPALVHSQVSNADSQLSAFRRNTKRWLVSVAMVSEGVDIKRLRVLIYLPNAQTELFFRQAIGRVVRSLGQEDDSRAYVIMPAQKSFDNFARSVEQEMSASALKKEAKKLTKICPVCDAHCHINAIECHDCGHEFNQEKNQYKHCHVCDAENELDAEECIECGEKFKNDFCIDLKDSLRAGAIVRGMDLDEEEVLTGERLGPSLRADILSSGDEALIKLMSKLPDEAAGRLAKIISRHSD